MTISDVLKQSLRKLGYEVRRVPRRKAGWNRTMPPSRDQLPRVAARWPLPLSPMAGDAAWIKEQFARFDLWHYAYKFEGGLEFSTRHNHPGPRTDDPRRAVQRFGHFMPDVVLAAGGSLAGKRVLDIACNSGFWSVQCALLGAQVVGFDARPELIEQANLIKKITGVENVEFRLLDFWDMTPEALGGQFDVVLNLGILYHLAEPLRALQLTKAMTRDVILLDTVISSSADAVVRMQWEEPLDIRDAATPGVVSHPSKSAVELMLRHVGVKSFYEVPVRSSELPRDYLTNRRTSWLIRT
jgi:2-polyprenyl-3-methyl-5-hydroxy-6-metoxy-1,4-benzoquinol methylase